MQMNGFSIIEQITPFDPWWRTGVFQSHDYFIHNPFIHMIYK